MLTSIHHSVPPLDNTHSVVSIRSF